MCQLKKLVVKTTVFILLWNEKLCFMCGKKALKTRHTLKVAEKNMQLYCKKVENP